MQDTDDKTTLARERTEWAEDRTVLANERTFAGWMRTGMAAMAIAVALRAVFDVDGAPLAPGRFAATVFILIAILMFWLARHRALTTLRRLDAHTARPIRSRNMTLITVCMSLGAAITGALLWLL